MWIIGRQHLSTLLKRLQEAVDKSVESSVSLTEPINLLNGVNHGRVMLSAETLSDLREGVAG